MGRRASTRALAGAFIKGVEAATVIGYPNMAVLVWSISADGHGFSLGVPGASLVTLLVWTGVRYPHQAIHLLSCSTGGNTALVVLVITFGLSTFVSKATATLLVVWALQRLAADAVGALLAVLTAATRETPQEEQPPGHPHAMLRLTTKLGGRIAQFSYTPGMLPPSG
jgi:hypothetical protein